MNDNRLKDLAGVAYRTLLPTTNKWHLLAVLVFLSTAMGIAAVATRTWTLPSSTNGLDLSTIRTSVTEWLAEGLVTLRLPTAWGILLLVLVVLVGVVAHGGWSQRQTFPRGLAGVVAVVATGGIRFVIVKLGAPLSADQSLVNGGAVAIALVVIGLISMMPLTPTGLRASWIIVWLVIVTIADRVVLAHWTEIVMALSEPGTIPKVLFGGAGAFLLTQLLGRVAPWLTTSFVDVVRYVDTSPRSYEVRRAIRNGLVDLLEQLHDRPEAKQYHRILVIAHSLGSYIAYDAISSLWYRRAGPVNVGNIPCAPNPFDQGAYRQQQKDVFATVAAATTKEGAYPAWRIAHLLTFGSPMYLADTLVTRTRAEFRRRRDDHLEFFTCPPPDDVIRLGPASGRRWLRSLDTGPGDVTPIPEVARREVAAFGVVQWTNVWYPVRAGLFGDPFGGPLASLFGSSGPDAGSRSIRKGIKDEPIRDDYWSFVPYAAHAAYTKSKPGKTGSGPPSFYQVVRDVITYTSDAGGGDSTEEQ
jgi:hypothetical protein